METSSKKILDAMPDFNQMLDLLSEIKGLSFKRMKLEKEIRESESLTFTTVMTNTKYFQNGKQPSVSYFDNAWKFTGIDGSTIKLREELITTVTELDARKNIYELYKSMQDMYKTTVFAERQ
jgi:hypothetical protein